MHSIQRIIDDLMYKQTRESTAKTYLSIWQQFNTFLVCLDEMPQDWEQRTTLFVAHLIQRGMQSSTVKPYVSAIKKCVLRENYPWDDNRLLLTSLTKACKLVNDQVTHRFPIHCGLLELILFEIERMLAKNNQCYLVLLYQTMFTLGYYGLFRVGELTKSPHVMKAKDIHMGMNKDKLLIVLHSSKTHSRANHLQNIKITANTAERMGAYIKRHFCPMDLVSRYLKQHGNYTQLNEQFFVFRDGTPVLPDMARKVLKSCINNLGLNPRLYDLHSFRIGRASDLAKYHYSVEEIKRMGRWKSNAVYKYIRF